jgi:cytosine deaminase
MLYMMSDLSSLPKADREAIELAFLQAKTSADAGGLPIGAVLTRNGEVVAIGHNQRVQKNDPIAHGEMDCLRNAGRQATYRDTTLFTSLSPCMMCAGTIVQFKIPRVVINDVVNFGGNEQFLRDRGVDVVVVGHKPSMELMAKFIKDNPHLWNEDIME